MEVSVGTRFSVRPTGGPLGAYIVDFPWTDFGPGEVDALRRAWVEHLVVRFRAAVIDDATQVRFTRMLGPHVLHPRQLQQGAHASSRDILVVSNLKNPDGTPAGDLGDGEVQWHTDTWFKERPPAGALLRALKLPRAGGNTQFANMYLAYEALPPELKRTVEGRHIHQQTVIDGRGDVRLGMTRPASDDVRTWPGVDHPIVRTHGESRRKCLYLGGGKKYQSIVGLPLDEGREILKRLWAHATQPQFVWMQEWQLGDAVMWDNRCVMHRRDAFDPNEIRLMHRTVFEGERPQ